MAEFRWILLGLGLLLIVGIWWWGARRSGQAPGNAELRESPHSEPVASVLRVEAEPKDWGVPPFEPLSIRTADFDRVPVLDGPMMVNPEPVRMNEATAPAPDPVAAALPTPMPQAAAAAAAAPPRRVLDVTAAAAPPTLSPPTPPPTLSSAPPAASPPTLSPTPPTLSPAPPAASPALPTPAPPPSRPPPRSARMTPAPTPGVEHSDRFGAVTPQVPNASELQRIVTIRVCAVGDMRWSGAELMAALELHGLAYGRYQVYHRRHADGRSLFCAASLIEPGTFDMTRMAEDEFRGVTLFAVLPGPAEPLQTVDELFATARGLAEEMSGMVQDAKGMPMSPQRAAALREDIARFQASLPGA